MAVPLGSRGIGDEIVTAGFPKASCLLGGGGGRRGGPERPLAIRGSSREAGASDTESTVDEIDNYLEARLSEAGRPGLAAAVVHDGDIVSTLEFGHARPGVPMTSETPMFIASVSKSITAMALMQQVDAGRVDLDEPVTTYLPELAPEGNRVAVRDLMHQRSGLTRYVGNESWSGDLVSSLETNVRRLGPHLEANAPFAYSNANYDAIALIVQRVSETPFGEYVSNNVFTPLEMDASFVGPIRLSPAISAPPELFQATLACQA